MVVRKTRAGVIGFDSILGWAGIEKEACKEKGK